jgi:hypothetical protein
MGRETEGRIRGRDRGETEARDRCRVKEERQREEIGGVTEEKKPTKGKTPRQRKKTKDAEGRYCI